MNVDIVTTEEVIAAIKDTNPNKAIGIDNISLKPLDQKECVWVRVRGRNYMEHIETF